MYSSSNKPSKEDNCNYKPRKAHRNTPSFSSTLLDEIYNSIDGNEQKKANGLKVFDEKPLRKHSNFSSVRVEESTAKVRVGARRRISLMSELEKSAFQETNPEKIKPKVISSEDHHRKNKTGNDLTMKNKSTVYNKVYANLKKVKQPISPGGKIITSLINSLFAERKSKKIGKDKVVQLQGPSSVSSSSRSRVEMRDGLQRTVKFHPLRPPNISEKSGSVKHIFKSNNKNDLTMVKGTRDDDDNDDDDEDDGFSDASSDLFELDHKAMFGKSRFFEELSVYETAYCGNNRVI